MNLDITFCSRNCENTKCKRNQKNLPPDVKYISVCNFKDCKDYKMELQETVKKE